MVLLTYHPMDGSPVASSEKRMQIPIQVVGSSTFGRYPKISARKTYNMFISDEFLVPYAGYKRLLQLEPQSSSFVSGRGVFRSVRGQLVIAVINSAVWSLDETLGATFIGNIATNSGPVFMAENLSGQICIVDGINAYIYNRFNLSLTQQTSVQIPGWLIPNYVCFHDTYFLIGNGDTTGNGALWGAFSADAATTITLTYELALQTKADYARAIVPLSEKGNNVLVFGSSVCEIQNNVGGLQGYQRVSTINSDYGVLSVATIATSDNFVCWLAINESSPPVIMYFDGGQHHTISTDGIDYLLGTINAPEKSIGFIFKEDGHVFYQITFYDPNDNLTLIYDFESKKFFHLSDANLNYHPARQVVTIGNRNFFISLNNGSLYEMGTTFTSYDENILFPRNPNYDFTQNYVIPRQVICDTARLPGRPDTFRGVRFNLLMEQGEDDLYSQLAAEIQVGVEYTPNVSLSYSKNGGVTFSNEVPRVMNYNALRENITQWTRLGRMNEFTAKLKFWGYGRFVVQNAILEIII